MILVGELPNNSFVVKPLHLAANIMIYINISADKYQNNINKQSYIIL